uniref:Ig-like domain-containing protein n=1 Tax=Poecilia formosa TaxID=48698 RepID=A0A096MEJ0_POEFO
MLRGLVALFLLSAVSVIPSLEVSLYIPLIEAALGENVTLLCHVKGYDSGLFYWYKTNCEYLIQTVAQGYFKKVDLEAQFKTVRFDIQTEGNVYSLIIRNIQKEDEGTYLCQAGEAYRMAFVNGTKLAVKHPGHKNQKSVYVKQISETTSVPLGTEITLECSLTLLEKNKAADRCAAEHSVFWFKAGSQSDPGMMFAARNICDSEPGRSCSYRLSKTIQNPSDAGIYHCAVVTCGGILFGEGTKVELEEKWDPLVIGLAVLLGLCVIVIACLIFSR